MADFSKPELQADFLPRLGRHLAHELNNPISAISSAAFLIQDFIETTEGGKVDVEMIKPFVESISEECEKLKSVVEEFSKYVATESILAMPIEVNEFVRMRVVEMVRDGQLVTFHGSEGPTTIIGDAGALQFVLRALVSYSLVSGATLVTISVSNGSPSKGAGSLSKAAGEQCVITIRDDRGQPPADDEIADVFDPLPKRRTTGLGLKLPLVKKLIELHHGSIELRALGSGGAEVFIVIPKA